MNEVPIYHDAVGFCDAGPTSPHAVGEGGGQKDASADGGGHETPQASRTLFAGKTTMCSEVCSASGGAEPEGEDRFGPRWVQGDKPESKLDLAVARATPSTVYEFDAEDTA